MTKFKITLLTLCLWCSANSFAQYKSNIAFKFGINYIFIGKQSGIKSSLKSGLDFKTAVAFKASDYFYVGPQLSLTRLWHRDSKANKGLTFVEIAPMVQLNLNSFINNKVLKPKNTNYQNSDLVFNFALGFNLDKQTENKEMFNLTRFSVGFDAFSKKLLNSSLLLNTELNLHYNRPLIKHTLGLGLGTALALKK